MTVVAYTDSSHPDRDGFYRLIEFSEDGETWEPVDAGAAMHVRNEKVWVVLDSGDIEITHQDGSKHRWRRVPAWQAPLSRNPPTAQGDGE